MFRSHPPEPIHVAGVQKGEEMVRRKGREPGRQDNLSRPYRSARDSTSLHPEARDPIDPRMPNIPPA